MIEIGPNLRDTLMVGVYFVGLAIAVWSLNRR